MNHHQYFYFGLLKQTYFIHHYLSSLGKPGSAGRVLDWRSRVLVEQDTILCLVLVQLRKIAKCPNTTIKFVDWDTKHQNKLHN